MFGGAHPAQASTDMFYNSAYPGSRAGVAFGASPFVASQPQLPLQPQQLQSQMLQQLMLQQATMLGIAGMYPQQVDNGACSLAEAQMAGRVRARVELEELEELHR
eukprot:4671179-Pleurochrysis_carterae.AAC.1